MNNNSILEGKTFSLTREEIDNLLKSVPAGIKEYINELEGQIRNLADIGVALSKEKDMNKLLEIILIEAKRISSADGGTLYMMTEDKRLKYEIMMTDSLGIHYGGTAPEPVPDTIYPVKLYLPDTGEPNYHNICAYAALTGKTMNIEDAYEAEGFDFTGTKGFDKRHGYRSKSFLTVPMKNHEDKIIGVLQLLNAKDLKTGEITPFSTAVEVVEALASQAAVAITNKILIKDLENLFESFIKLIASAIDEKSPYTGGHCQRVPEITMMLAEAVNNIKDGPFADIHFDDKQMYELKIAAWLHDAGKVATPEYVVDKATKLETIYDRIHTVATRFEILKRDEEIRFIKKRLKLESDSSLNEMEKKETLKKLRKGYRSRIQQLDDDLEFLKSVNIGGEFMSPDKKERVRKIAKYHWKENDKVRDFLSKDEVYNLCIVRGTLTPEERQVINDHIVVTIKMLEQLPYPKHLRNVPEYAGGHHEKLDGTGYPKGLNRDEMSIQARMMVIADIFEALTASDRPYKKGKNLSQAMRIMGFMKADTHIDADLFDIFVREKIYDKYAQKYLPPEQVDEVNV